MEWAAFERVDGPMLIGDRIDYAGAVVAYVTAASHGADVSFRKIMRSFFDHDRPEVSETHTSMELGQILEAASQLSPH